MGVAIAITSSTTHCAMCSIFERSFIADVNKVEWNEVRSVRYDFDSHDVCRPITVRTFRDGLATE